MKVILLRHGKTRGNEEHRYIGQTDEGLSAGGREALLRERAALREQAGLEAELPFIFASPMRRCRESAELLFPEAEIMTEERLREISFGVFENRSYQELNGRADYQAWIDSGGTLDFPGGEPLAEFKRRSLEGFFHCISAARRMEVEQAVFIVHGGTVMAVLEALAEPRRPYYDWQVRNGEGFCCSLEGERLTVHRRLDGSSSRSAG